MVGDELVARLAWVVLELVLLNIQTNVGLPGGLGEVEERGWLGV